MTVAKRRCNGDDAATTGRLMKSTYANSNGRFDRIRRVFRFRSNRNIRNTL
jgi:hypothetical protein